MISATCSAGSRTWGPDSLYSDRWIMALHDVISTWQCRRQYVWTARLKLWCLKPVTINIFKLHSNTAHQLQDNLDISCVYHMWENLFYLASFDPQSSINQKPTDAHYIALFHLLPAPSTNCESSKSNHWKQKTIYSVNLANQMVKIETEKCVSCWGFLDYTYIVLWQ